jgi:hypothetical protein
MVLHGDTDKTLAKHLGISNRTFSNKINERGGEFNKREISAIIKRYDLTEDQVMSIFFN